jgi:CRP-like cAMP-binding protein
MSSRAVAADAATIEIFKGLPPEALEECASLAVRRTLPPRQVVFGQGERCTRFQALLSGWLRISQAGRDGGQALMRFTGPGEIFGAFAIFGDHFYPAEAVTLSECEELSWSELHIRQLMASYPPLAMNMLSLAARRLGELQERLREIATQKAEQRIANALLRLSDKASQRFADGSVEIAWPLTRRDVASLSATTLCTASRILAQWERRGLVASGRARIAIRSPRELGRIGEDDA